MAVVALSAFGGLYSFANRALYYPSKYPEGLWDLQRSYTRPDVYLDTADAYDLHACRVPAQMLAFVTCTCTACRHVSDRFRQIQEITAAGSSTLILEYRGYGKQILEKASIQRCETAFIPLAWNGLPRGHHSARRVAGDRSRSRPGFAPSLLLADSLSALLFMTTSPGVKCRYSARCWSGVSIGTKYPWIQAPKLFIQGNH